MGSSADDARRDFLLENSGEVEELANPNLLKLECGCEVQNMKEKKDRTWEMWTLSEEDIVEAAEDHLLTLKNVDLEEVVLKFKKCFAELVGTSWDETLADCIKEVQKEAQKSCKVCVHDEDCAGNDTGTYPCPDFAEINKEAQ